MRRGVIIIVSLMLIGLISGCQSTRFYTQAIVGQSRLLLMREDTAALLVSPHTDPALRERLLMVDELLAFSNQNGLASHGAYQSYVETKQPYVVWNVFATKPFDLALKQSCFPIAGCVTYRGYFQQAHAMREAARLAQAGYEVYVGGVTAYSTLGWFDDPLLDTFLFRSDEQVAALIFHELAHQFVYVQNDTRFNESLATAVEQHLLEQWLTSIDQPEQFAAWRERQGQQAAVIELINTSRASLRELYVSGLSEELMRATKHDVIGDLRLSYQALLTSWNLPDDAASPFSSWMAQDINNAKLETVADYHEWVPALTAFLNKQGFEAFKQELLRLADLGYSERQAALESMQGGQD